MRSEKVFGTVDWDQLIANAALGTDTSGSLTGALPGELGRAAAAIPAGTAAAQLLDIAALVTLAERAGGPVRRGTTRSAPPPAESRKAVSSTVATALQGMFSDAAARLFPMGVLPEMLRAVDNAGRRLPSFLLPTVLDLARRDLRLLDAGPGAVGTLGPWLAAENPDWSLPAAFLVGTAGDPAVLPPVRWWSAATPSVRNAWFAGFRRAHRAAAAALLESEWRRLANSDRTILVATLGRDLTADDERVIRTSSTSDHGELRSLGEQLLARLPDRIDAGQAWASVADLLSRRGSTGRLTWTGPTDATAVVRLVAAVPLPAWSTWGPASGVVHELGGLRPVGAAMVRGLAWAVTHQVGLPIQLIGEWAAALVVFPLDVAQRAALIPLLPENSMANQVFEALRAAAGTGPGDDTLEPVLAAWPGPWTLGMTSGALQWLDQQSDTSPKGPGKATSRVRMSVANLLAERLLPESGDEVERIADQAASVVRPALLATVEVLNRRRQLLRELI